MGMTNAGATACASFIIGTADSSPVTKYDATNAYVAVGSVGSGTPFAATQTALAGELGRVLVDSGYPQRSGAVLTFRATFGGSAGTGTWNEWGIFNASTAGTMLNRAIPSPSLGPKSSGQTWQITAQITVGAA